MGQVRHGSATTTHAVRAAIQRSQASISELSRELGINPKTVAKWRKRQSVEDQKTGPREPRSTVLSQDEEAMVVAFRRHTLLPLDDCLYALQPSIPHLTRFTCSLEPMAFTGSLSASLLAASRDITPSRHGWGQTQTAEVQTISHWLFSYRHRRSQNRRRKAVSLCGH